MAGNVKHDYHLVAVSPWPLVGSISALGMMMGAVAWRHSGLLFGISGPWLFILGLSGILLTFVGWWRDVIKESLTGENTTAVVRFGLRYGMILFILSEVMFFAAWFWAFFGAGLFPTAGEAITLADGTQMLNSDGAPAHLFNDAKQHALGGVWPPKNVEPLSAWQLPLLNTLILLLSGTTVTWAHHALEVEEHKGLMWGLSLTIILGIIFTYFQFLEYKEVFDLGLYSFSGNIYGATFFMATGFHGFHVLIGTIFLIVCWFRARARHFTPDRHLGFLSAAWYWHFVDVVWLFLFASIYVLGNNGFPLLVP